MRVLYVNHTGALGGAERSLLELLAVLPDEVEPTVACPDGPFAEAVRNLGICCLGLHGVNGGLRLDPRQTPSTLFRIAADAVTIRRQARRTGVEIVHANSIRAGLAAAAAGVPTIVFVRDCLPAGRVAALTKTILRSRSALLLANSSYTAASFGPSGSGRLRVAHPAVDLQRFDPGLLPRAAARARIGIGLDAPALGVVAQLTPWKGQDDAIRMVAALRPRFPGVRLLLVGAPTFDHPATRFDNLGYERRLHELASECGVAGAVEFLGQRDDVPELLRALDLVLCPSWEEPFGRSVLEAMAMEVPVLATNVGGPAELVTDGVEGLLLPPRSPERWADAAAVLLTAPKQAATMGRAGRRRAEGFSREAHLASVMDAYASVVA